jgi:hypothetical protein
LAIVTFVPALAVSEGGTYLNWLILIGPELADPAGAVAVVAGAAGELDAFVLLPPHAATSAELASTSAKPHRTRHDNADTDSIRLLSSGLRLHFALTAVVDHFSR